MTWHREQLRAAIIALLRLALFLLLFVVFERALSTVLLSLSRSNGFLLETTATLLSALLAGWLLLAALEQRPAGDLGFRISRMALPQAGWGNLLGVGGLLTACVFLLLVGGLRYTAQGGTFAQWLAGALKMFLLLLIPAAAEEALFRGYAFQKLVDAFGAVLATIGASAAFAFAHMQNPGINTFALLNIFLAGVMLSAAYLRTRSLWFATGVHLGWNWSMVALGDLPVSGLRLYDAPLYDAVERGPAWLSGGGFGPEAGLAGLIGLGAAFAGVWWITRNRQWQT